MLLSTEASEVAPPSAATKDQQLRAATTLVATTNSTERTAPYEPIHRPRTIIDQPGLNDVVCSQKRSYQNHPGNIAYVAILEEYLTEYRMVVSYDNKKHSSSKQEVMRITKKIVADMKSRFNSRFIRPVHTNRVNPGETSTVWEEISDATARDKVRHALAFKSRARISNKSNSSMGTGSDGEGDYFYSLSSASPASGGFISNTATHYDKRLPILHTEETKSSCDALPPTTSHLNRSSLAIFAPVSSSSPPAAATTGSKHDKNDSFTRDLFQSVIKRQQIILQRAAASSGMWEGLVQQQPKTTIPTSAAAAAHRRPQPKTIKTPSNGPLAQPTAISAVAAPTTMTFDQQQEQTKKEAAGFLLSISRPRSPERKE
jgi:hypothetical protein